MNRWRKSRRVGRCAAALVLTIAVAARAEGPFRSLGYDAALAAAQKEKKLVFIDFYTTWCRPCRLLDESTWKDAAVVRLLSEKTVALKVDAEKEVALARKYSITAYPTLVLLSAAGEEIDRFSGYLPPKQFLDAVAPSMSGRDSLTRAREAVAAAEATNPLARMQLARIFVQRGKYDDALAEYLKCFDRVPADDAQAETRLWVVLADLARLSQYHAPAREALAARRDARERELFAAAATSRPAGALVSTRPIVADYVFINAALGDPARSIRTYDRLSGDAGARGDVVAELRNYLFDQLLAARRYADCTTDVPVLFSRFDRSVAELHRLREAHAAARAIRGSEVQAAPDASRLLLAAGQFHEALLGARRDADARKMAERILAVDADGKTHVLLIQSAMRAGRRDEAVRLVEQARRLVPRQRALIDAAAKRIGA